MHYALPQSSARIERIAIASAIAVILVICAVSGVWLKHERYLILRNQGHRTSDNLALVLKQQITGSIQAVDLTLLQIADTLQLLAPLPDHDPEFENSMRRALTRLPSIRALFTIGPDGFITQDTDYPTTPHANLADRDYFKVHVENPKLGLYIGPPLRSRSTGTWFVSLSRRIDGPDGAFGGIVVAALEVQRFESFYRTLELGPTDSIALFLRDGTLLLRSPPIDRLVGQRLPDLPLFKTHLSQSPSGSYETPSLDGGMKIISYRAVEGYPLVVTVALSEDALLKQWRRNVLIAMATSLGFAAAIMFFTIVFIRAQRRYERAQARQLETQHLETLGRMTGGVAHDINNLLAIVASGTRMLARGERLNAEASAQILNQVSEAVARGRALMSQLLSFAKRQELDVQAVAVNERIERLSPLVRQAAGRNVDVRLELAKDVPACRADPAQFDAALLNLVVNARDAMPRGGVLRIATSNRLLESAESAGFGVPPDAYVEVCVSDTGEGMTPETARHAVEPFFSTKGDAGTGLGLSQVYGFVRQVGGDLSIDSAVGKGTAVRLLFRRADPGTTAARPSPA